MHDILVRGHPLSVRDAWGRKLEVPALIRGEVSVVSSELVVLLSRVYE
jgi:hypothetical protein